MNALKRVVPTILFACVVASGASFAQQPSTQSPATTPPQVQQQDEFVPIGELPPQDQLPAAPLLVSAYAVVMLALFFYILSVARRLTHAQRDLARLEADVKRGGRV